mmetsp:Transcript_26613/g.76382  ORF Transcript_26613/g.76382 Transcript_26613/m.76382 type:complete len:226 (-) Transcript_26613:302-979(-)
MPVDSSLGFPDAFGRLLPPKRHEGDEDAARHYAPDRHRAPVVARAARAVHVGAERGEPALVEQLRELHGLRPSGAVVEAHHDLAVLGRNDAERGLGRHLDCRGPPCRGHAHAVPQQPRRPLRRRHARAAAQEQRRPLRRGDVRAAAQEAPRPRRWGAVRAAPQEPRRPRRRGRGPAGGRPGAGPGAPRCRRRCRRSRRPAQRGLNPPQRTLRLRARSHLLRGVQA